MKQTDNNKYIVIISIICIIGTVIFGIIYSKNENKAKTSNNFEEYFHDYEVNEIQKLYLSLEEVSRRYLANLVSDILYNPRDVYNRLDKETEEKYPNYSDFEYMISKIKTTNFLSADVKKYSSGVVNNKNAIYIIDKDDNNFIFIENSINNYSIRIN